MLSDCAEERGECLRTTRVAKASHVPLAPSRRLVIVLRAVAYPPGRFDEHMLYLREFRDVCLCCRLTAHLVGSDLVRHRI